MITLRKATAKEGYVWKVKNEDMVLGEVLYLGKEDSIDRYEQVLEIIEQEEDEEVREVISE